MIKLGEALCFSEVGRKDNQEDYLFPQSIGDDNRVFILCDGMGGHDNGEVASKTAATTLGDYLDSSSKIDIPTFETGLSKAYDALDGIDTNSAKKPGTTLACVCFNEDSYLVAHIGDSRIYHIRPSLYNPKFKRGGILYQSSDHSLVNDLLKAGEITEEEARDFPQKNIITKAMQPHLERRYNADVFEFDDIAEGDYFFLCCDGILEQLSNEMLCEILADKSIDNNQKLAKIKSICDNKTRDNYTCWLIPIEQVKIEEKRQNEHVITAVEEEKEEQPITAINEQTTKMRINESIPVHPSVNKKINVKWNSFLSPLQSNSWTRWIFYVFILMVCIAFLMVLWYFLKIFVLKA